MSMDLSEREAAGHCDHWLGMAADCARAAVTDMRAPLRVVPALKCAQEAARGIGLLRSDERWLSVARGLQPLIDLGQPKGWRPYDLRWAQMGAHLDRVRALVVREFGAARTGAVQVVSR